MMKPPWKQKQIDALNAYQMSGMFHPFTCGSGNRTDEKHLDGQGILEATADGWICPFCDYKQDWAHEFMAQDKPKDPMQALMEKSVKIGLFDEPTPVVPSIAIEVIKDDDGMETYACNVCGYFGDHRGYL